MYYCLDNIGSYDGLFDSSDTAAWNWGGRSKAYKKTLFREYAQRVAQCQQTMEQQTRLTNGEMRNRSLSTFIPDRTECVARHVPNQNINNAKK
jgi:hypothetical protein